MALAVALLAPPQAMAQDQADTAAGDEESQSSDNTPTIEEVVVTGTGTNISGVKNVGSETLILDREEMLSGGNTTVADVVRKLPQVQTVSGGNAQGTPNGGGTTRGNSINLRGLGQGATLILVDGHRVSPSGTASAFTEANQVPLAAVERVEVIADGASAIYGSDAIAGVVNYVLRKDFDGLEIGGRYTFGDYNNDDRAIHFAGGTHWDINLGEGSILLAYEYSKRDAYVRGLNPRLREDQRPYGGIDNRVTYASGPFASFPGGSPALNGNILVRTADGGNDPGFPQGGSFTYYALPMNPDGSPLTAADLRRVDANCADDSVCTSYPNVVDGADYADFIGQQTRNQMGVFLRQEIGPIEFYDEFFWNKSEQSTNAGIHGAGNSTPLVRVAPGNPNYIAGITPGTLAVQINLAERGVTLVNDTPDENFNNTFGARANIIGDWNVDAFYTYGQDKACGVCYLGNYVSYETNADFSLFGEPILGIGQQSAIQNAVDSGLINPFSTAPLSQDAKDYILGTNSQYSQNFSHDVVVKFDGSLFDIPGGTAKAAVGGEYYHGRQQLQNAANRPPDPGSITTPDADARTIREQYAAFAELYLPIIGYDMEVPLMQELTISTAARYDHYSDFGSTTNPKISASWVVNDSLSFRGSWGKSFRAPGLPELNGGVFSVGLGFANATVPGITGVPQTCDGTGNCTVNTLFIIGNNPNLEAERGKNWQIGVDFTPEFARGLRMAATYYNIHYKNKLGSSGVPSNPFTSVDTYNQYMGRVIPLNAPASCSNDDPSTFDPALLEYYDFLYEAAITFQPRNYCGLQAVVDGRTISAAQAFQDGLDFNVTYSLDTDIGFFNFGANVTKIFNSNQVTVLGGPTVDILDTITNPISLRGRANISYQRGVFAANLFANYTGDYENNQPISVLGVVQPESHVSSWTTFDLNLALSFSEDAAPWSPLNNVRIGMTVSNIFNNDPPVVLSSAIGNASIDTYTHNAYGRYVQLNVSKAF